MLKKMGIFTFKVLSTILVISVGCILLSTPVVAKSPLVVKANQTKGSFSHVGAGFLLTPTTPDADTSYLQPLSPSLYRTQDPQIFEQNNYARLKNLGARVQFITYADYFGKLAVQGVWPGDNNDWSAWEKSLRETINKIKAQNYSVEYEIWNEPDVAFFWGRDKTRFFELWKRSYQIIKNNDPNAVIVGPSIGIFNESYLKDFLNFAKENNVVPDILSWHELEENNQAVNITNRVTNMKNWMSVQQIPVKEIVINEFLNPTQMTSPGDLVQYLAAFEYNHVYGSRACWDEQNTVSGCWNYSLNNVLTPDNKKPRSDWWVYQKYSQLKGDLIEITPINNLFGIAALNTDTKQLQILLGKKKNDASATEQVVVSDVVSAGISKEGGTVNIQIQKISYLNGAELTNLPAQTSQDLVVINNQLSVNLDFASGDAYLLKITPEELAVPTICLGDFNGDQITDLSDYAIFTQDFLKTAPKTKTIRTDINGDGIVDLSDYLLLKNNFMQACQR
jgi:hypothetical protein